MIKECKKCGELLEWYRECGWVHVNNPEDIGYADPEDTEYWREW